MVGGCSRRWSGLSGPSLVAARALRIGALIGAARVPVGAGLTGNRDITQTRKRRSTSELSSQVTNQTK